MITNNDNELIELQAQVGSAYSVMPVEKLYELNNRINEQLAYSTVVAHHLADALIYIDTLREKIETCGDVVEGAVFEGLPETEFCYEEAAKAAVQSDEDAIRGIKADAILSVNEQGFDVSITDGDCHIGQLFVGHLDIEAYAEQVREGLK